jgi:hypothetical protein
MVALKSSHGLLAAEIFANLAIIPFHSRRPGLIATIHLPLNDRG